MRMRPSWTLNQVTSNSAMVFSLYLLGKLATILIVPLLAWCVKRYPESLLGRLAKTLLATTSPKPMHREAEHDFLKRYGLWAFKWFFQLAVVWLAAAYIFGSVAMNSMLFQGVSFILAMLAAMSLLGSVL